MCTLKLIAFSCLGISTLFQLMSVRDGTNYQYPSGTNNNSGNQPRDFPPGSVIFKPATTFHQGARPVLLLASITFTRVSTWDNSPVTIIPRFSGTGEVTFPIVFATASHWYKDSHLFTCFTPHNGVLTAPVTDPPMLTETVYRLFRCLSVRIQATKP